MKMRIETTNEPAFISQRAPRKENLTQFSPTQDEEKKNNNSFKKKTLLWKYIQKFKI